MSGNGSLPGPDSWNWKGWDIGYEGAHRRMSQMWGFAKEHPCALCGQPAKEWAYDGTDPTQKLGKRFGTPYSVYPEFYLPACYPCHRAKDAAKEVCGNGHEMTLENTAMYPSRPNRRKCRKCERARVNSGYLLRKSRRKCLSSK